MFGDLGATNIIAKQLTGIFDNQRTVDFNIVFNTYFMGRRNQDQQLWTFKHSYT
jgi:hypothetical protein